MIWVSHLPGQIIEEVANTGNFTLYNIPWSLAHIEMIDIWLATHDNGEQAHDGNNRS